MIGCSVRIWPGVKSVTANAATEMATLTFLSFSGASDLISPKARTEARCPP